MSMSVSVNRAAAPAPAAQTGSGGILDGNLIAAAGFAAVDKVVDTLSVPGTDQSQARIDLSHAEIGQTLSLAKDAVALLHTGEATASDRFLGRNAGFAAEHAAKGVEALTWLEDVVGNGLEINPQLIDQRFAEAHQQFRSAQDAYGLE